MKKQKVISSENLVRNHIAQGTSIVGDLNSNGDFRIEGKLKGTITANGKIVIGETGEIEGDMSCQLADISGKVIGNIKVEELTMLKQHSQFEGIIITKQLTVEPGAIFTGECQMGNPSKEPDISKKK
ncbi:MAG: polymer-forming cytoskeletal protein [Bacteroidales bacterium]|nr:polymer-forming cytoskeletal protein [Bacteroidales bacterium]